MGQAVSSRLAKQIKKSSKKIAADVATYNEMRSCPTVSTLPTSLSFEEATDSKKLLEYLHPNERVSSFFKRQVVALFHKKQRSIEEKHHVVKDIHASCNFLKEQHSKILSVMRSTLSCDMHVDEDTPLDLAQAAQVTSCPGKLAFLFHKLINIEKEGSKLSTAVSKIVPVDLPTSALDFMSDFLSSNKVLASEDEINDEQDLCLLLEELDSGETNDVTEVLEAFETNILSPQVL